MDQSKKHSDRAQVIAAIVQAARGTPDGANALLRSKRPVIKNTVSRELTEELYCGRPLRLAPDAKVIVGGGAVVIQCEDKDAPGVHYALKVARPSLFSDQTQSDVEFAKAEREYKTHLPLAHENIAKMFGFDGIDVRLSRALTLRLPCTLIEWVDDPTPFDDYIARRINTPQQLVHLLAQACRALSHLHASSMIHWDVKGDNLLVSACGFVKLMDLGNARPRSQYGGSSDFSGV